MSFGADEEILQDFLVEAGEILEQLSEQLVELESRPDDADLLNAIFRGFHTVKGGAGFLQLHELVECCHIAENVFDILRKGERRVDSELMDVVLEALDTVNSMFGQVRERTDVTPATPELLAALARLARSHNPPTRPLPLSRSRWLKYRLLLRLQNRRLATRLPMMNSSSCSIRCTAPARCLQRLHRRQQQQQQQRLRRRVMRSPIRNLNPCSISCMARANLRPMPQPLRPLHLWRRAVQRLPVMKSPTTNSKRCSINCTAKARLMAL